MIAGQRLNNHFIEMVGSTTKATASSIKGESQGRSVEMYLDFMILEWTSLAAATDMVFAGSYPGFGWFEANMPANASPRNHATVKFGVSRNSTIYYSSTGTIYLGRRHVMTGKDSGVIGGESTATLDGAALATATSGQYTAAILETPYDVKGSLDIGYDDFNIKYVKMRVYEFWAKVNGVLILHYRPTEIDKENALTSLVDKSPYGNDATLSGTLATDYNWRSAWSRDVTFAGGGE